MLLTLCVQRARRSISGLENLSQGELLLKPKIKFTYAKVRAVVLISARIQSSPGVIPFTPYTFRGVTNYQGELQGRTFTFNQSNLSIGAGLKYDLTPHFAVRTGIQYGTIGASDRDNSDAKLRPRNLSFQSRILEGNLLLEYTLFNMEDKKISPYVFGGIGLYHFNPFAFDTLGNKVS